MGHIKRSDIIDIEKFLDPDNPDYKIQVIAPTHTYGIVNSFNSKYDFDIESDEYDPQGLWEYNLLVKGEIVQTFEHLGDVEEYLKSK